MITEKLVRWQAYWVEFLSRFKFVIFYIPGRENKKANLFTCQPNNCPVDDHNN